MLSAAKHLVALRDRPSLLLRGVYPERSEWAQGKLREWAQDDTP